MWRRRQELSADNWKKNSGCHDYSPPDRGGVQGRVGPFRGNPGGLRTAALDLLNSSDEAAKLLSDAQAVRAALKPAAVKAPAGLADRILAKALGQTDKT